jgi:hypothetical protein
MTTNTSCPIWQTPATEISTSRDGRHINSPRTGGEYFASGTALAKLNDQDISDKIKLTSWLIEQRQLGVACPEVSSTALDQAMKSRLLSVHERADALLRFLFQKSDLIGKVVKFYKKDNSSNPALENELYAWTASRQISEVITLAEYCGQEGWIEHRVTERAGASENSIHELMLRPSGYARLAALDGVNAASKQAFIAMWFDDRMEDAYVKGIAPAVRDAGYEPLRIDGREHNNKIDDEIIAEIRRSRFVVADFTQGESGARGGVYYEAGFAHGLNIPVIFCCRKDAIDAVHFDTRQYNHITWETPDELRMRVAQRILATIGEGPLREAS